MKGHVVNLSVLMSPSELVWLTSSNIASKPKCVKCNLAFCVSFCLPMVLEVGLKALPIPGRACPLSCVPMPL